MSMHLYICLNLAPFYHFRMFIKPFEESFSMEVFPFIYWLQVYWRRIQRLFFYDFIWLL